MKKYMNVVFVVLILLSSCKKDLFETYPTDKISSETYWKTQEDATLAVNAIYQVLSEYYGDLPHLDAISDNAYSNYPWEGYKDLADGKQDARSPNCVSDYWIRCYRGIGRANTLLDNIDRIPEDKLSSDLRDQIKGEAKFLRAFFYFSLTDLYGGVPLILEAPTLEHGKLPRDTKEVVINKVLKELEEAALLLPVSYSGDDLGRVTSGAALALRTRVLLFNGKFSLAAQEAKRVMGMGYSLFPSYRGLFMEENENNAEVIFDVQYKAPEQGNYFNIYLPPYAANPAGWASVVPLPGLVEDYYMTDGLPTDQSSLYDPLKPYENRDSRLKQTIFVPGTKINGANLDDCVTYTGFAFKKYTIYDEHNEVPVVTYPEVTGMNAIVIRYADILLMYAEAQNEAVGPDASVYDAINQVRARESVQMAPVAAGLSQSEMREMIRHERRVEFPIEGLRYSDIRRWNIADDILNGLQDPGGTRAFDATKHYLWPIPGAEFDIDGNQLEQNPGYGK